MRLLEKKSGFWVKVIGKKAFFVASIMSIDKIVEQLNTKEFIAFGNITLQSKQVQYIRIKKS
jgi:hypothetical protein